MSTTTSYPIRSGVPQGSVFWVPFCTFYLHMTFPLHHTLHFADNVAALCKALTSSTSHPTFSTCNRRMVCQLLCLGKPKRINTCTIRMPAKHWPSSHKHEWCPSSNCQFGQISRTDSQFQIDLGLVHKARQWFYKLWQSKTPTHLKQPIYLTFRSSSMPELYGTWHQTWTYI